MPTRPLVTTYRDDLKLFPDRWHHIGITFWSIFLLLFPLLANDNWLTIGNITLITIVGAVGMMILTGFTGQISLGHAAFLALGAYTAGILGFQFGFPFWLILPIAGFLAAAVGLAVGPFALRLEGLYLAIVTLGLLFLVNHFLLAFPSLTLGVKGIAVPMHLWFAKAKTAGLTSFAKTSTLGPLSLTFAQKLYFLYLLLALASVAIAKNLHRSNMGRAMMAVRDHDIAASVMGVNPAHAKIISFGLSSFFAGVAGAMFGFQQQFITVDPPFNLSMSVQYIAIIVLGGIGTVFGAVSGAIAYTILSPITEMIGKFIPYLNTLSSHQQSIVLFSLIVCSFLLFEPLGLFGIWLRIKRYFMAWPFRY